MVMMLTLFIVRTVDCGWTVGAWAARRSFFFRTRATSVGGVSRLTYIAVVVVVVVVVAFFFVVILVLKVHAHVHPIKSQFFVRLNRLTCSSEFFLNSEIPQRLHLFLLH